MELENYLQKVGSATFVKYFALFEPEVAPSEAKAAIRKNDDFTESTLNSKVSNARRIFKEGLEKKALESIIKDGKQDKAILTKAAKLLEKAKTTKKAPAKKAGAKKPVAKAKAKPKTKKK
jgi:hypothetical protein